MGGNDFLFGKQSGLCWLRCRERADTHVCLSGKAGAGCWEPWHRPEVSLIGLLPESNQRSESFRSRGLVPPLPAASEEPEESPVAFGALRGHWGKLRSRRGRGLAQEESSGRPRPETGTELISLHHHKTGHRTQPEASLVALTGLVCWDTLRPNPNFCVHSHVTDIFLRKEAFPFFCFSFLRYFSFVIFFSSLVTFHR